MRGLKALSTSWNSPSCANAREIVEQIRPLGIEALELDFRLSARIVDEFLDLVNRRDVRISSVHNFCPMPPLAGKETVFPDDLSLASLDPEQRRQAVRATGLTIETAARLGARAVVLHTGRVEVPDHMRELIGLRRRQEPDGELRRRMENERSAHAAPHLAVLLRSLEELLAVADRAGVMIAVENRYYYREIPSFDEFGVLLGAFGGVLRYWHDAGHAQVFENLGFCKHRDLLDRYGAYLAGMHLHDVKDIAIDHQPPGTGMTDFSVLQSYLDDDKILKVFEVHRPATAEQVREGIRYLSTLSAPHQGMNQ